MIAFLKPYALLKDDTELFKKFFQSESFRRFVTDMVISIPQD